MHILKKFGLKIIRDATTSSSDSIGFTWYICLFVCLSVCLSVCLFVCLLTNRSQNIPGGFSKLIAQMKGIVLKPNPPKIQDARTYGSVEKVGNSTSGIRFRVYLRQFWSDLQNVFFK